jgi:putative spermidine/putrescine transport system substrate-binding protein
MDRRKFLLLGGAAIASIGGCQWSNPFDQSDRLRILGLLGAIPSKIINQFESSSQKKTEFKAENSPAKLWQELLNQPNFAKDKAQNLVSIGDSWLDLAIAQSLIQPIAPSFLEKIPQWQKLSPLWQQSVTRNNQIWGIPYRWGATAIAYREDKLKFDITQWSDLWRSELNQKLTLPDDAREVIGLVLKKMGQSYQQENIAERQDIAAIAQELKSLNSQVLTYTSDNYLQSLLADDTLVAVGWTSDMYRAKKQNPNLKIVIPKDGTSLWSDMWVIPKGEVPNTAAEWMNFCLTPAIASQITALTDAVSPISELDRVPASVKADPIKFFSANILANSELILPLSPATLRQYQDLWTKMRSGKL